MVGDLEEALEDFRSGPPVPIEPEPFAHLRAVHVVAEVLASMLSLDRAAALEMAERQIRALAVEKLAGWIPAGRGN